MCIFICLWGIKELFLQSGSSSDVRGQIITLGWNCWLQHFCHCSVVAGEELFANVLVPTASELEQMLQASDS